MRRQILCIEKNINDRQIVYPHPFIKHKIKVKEKISATTHILLFSVRQIVNPLSSCLHSPYTFRTYVSNFNIKVYPFCINFTAIAHNTFCQHLYYNSVSIERLIQKKNVELKCSDAQILLKDKRKTLLRCCIELLFSLFLQ